MNKLIIIVSMLLSYSFAQNNINQNIITILGTTNVHGEIDPCGWKKKPLGGLARKATIIENLSNQNINPIVLDAGDLFFKKDKIEPGITTDIAKINANIIVESFNKMGCDAFSPGSKDFASGLKFLKSLEKKSNFPFISANLVNKKGELLFQPYVINKHKGNRVAIVGLTSEFVSSEVTVLEPILALQNIVNKIGNDADLLILLFNASDSDLNNLYSSQIPVDFVLRSKGRVRSSDGGSKIPTYSAGDRGKIIYRFDLNLVDSNLPFIDIAWSENTNDRINSRLNKMKKGDESAVLEFLYKDDPATLNRIKNYKNQLEMANQLLENAINTVGFSKIELGKTVFDRPDILKIVDRGKVKIKDISGPPIGPILPPQPDHKGRMPGDAHYNHNH